jgi:hypothetical protein
VNVILANALWTQVSQMGFNLQDYEPVENRIAAFYEKYPKGRITTELVSHGDNQFIVKAFVWRDSKDEFVSATGYAEEKVGSSPVNRTSALENCETSAIGRSLANLGFATKGARPSREEMTKVESTNGNKPVSHVGGMPFDNSITEKQLSFVKEIVADAFLSSGWNNGKDGWKLVGEWLGVPSLTEANELNKKQASRIINDKMSVSNGVTELVKFLQSKQPADRDPWESPLVEKSGSLD